MIFKNLIREVEKDVHVQGAKSKDLIKGFINESILDFAKLDEWEKQKTLAVITLDGSDTYDLSDMPALIANAEPFFAELDIIGENKAEYQKLDYRTYLTAEDKSYYWCIVGETLHVTGTGVDINFLYKTLGTKYPLTDDNDEVAATNYYWDIIKKMSTLLFFEFMGDIEDKQIQYEEKILNNKLISTRRHENRIRNQGKPKVFRRG